jgi:predicted Zn-dependent peptidase
VAWAVLGATLLWAGPTPLQAQERQVPNQAPRARQPIYEPGQPVQRKTLKNGVRLLVQEQRTSDRVAGVVALRMGTLYETDEESGLSQVLMRMIPYGIKGMSNTQLQIEMRAAELTMEAGAGPDLGQVSVLAKRERVDKAIQLLSGVTLNPSFPDSSFEAARLQYLTRASDELEDPIPSTYAIFLRTMYQGSPFERPAFGTVHSISESRQSDILALYKKFFVGGNVTVCFVGNFDGKKVMSALEKTFAALPPGPAPARAGGEPVPLNADTLVREDRPFRAQSLVYGYAAPGYDQPDFAAFMIIDSYLRSGDRSPITYWLPERHLATGVGVLYPSYPQRSSIAVYLGAEPRNFKAARDTVASVLQGLATYPLDEGEWPVHIRRVQNAFFNDQGNPLVRARNLSRYETQSLGLDYPQRFETALLQLKPDDVRAAAARWFIHACEVTLMPAKDDSRP